MADTILSGRWKIHYEAENRQKRLERDTAVSPTTTDTVNALYSALQDQFDELAQMDDGTPMSAQTPTEYTIGIIDAGDDDPWFIDRTSVEYLTGGAIKSASWKRVTSTNTGIVRFDYTVGAGTDLATADIGKTITSSATSDSGTLLDFVTDGSNGTAWVRPADNTATHDWDGTPTDVSVTGGTGLNLTQDAAASTGESLWANIYSIGTIESNTHLYINQNSSLLTGYKSTTDWWGDGHVDILVNVKEVDTEVDEAVIKVLARQHSKLYDNFEVDLTAGGRNPIPLATADDLDNTVGHRQMVLTDAGGTFLVGETITDDTDSTIEGIVTSVSGTNPNVTLQYYLIGDPQNDFTGATGAFSSSGTGTGTAVAPTNVNAAADTSITVTFGVDETYDIDEDDTNENYSIVVDCNSQPLSEVYQRLQFLTRRGETADIDSGAQTITGQFYIGTDWRIAYTTLTGSISEGATVTQQTTGATGTVTAHNTTDKYLMLRNSRGTFNSTNQVEVDGSNYVTGPTSTVISPKKGTPLGNFAGGTFFGARGVVLNNVPAADANNYQLTDDDGNIVTAPTKVTVKIGNTRALDRVAMFRLTAAGGTIKKDTYTGTVQSAGATTLVVAESIATDEPGKTTGGIVRLVGADENTEYRLRFTSWTGSTFTLSATSSDTTEAGTDTDTIVATGAFTNAKVGDLIRNQTRSNAISYISSITDNDNAEIFPAISGQTTGDTFDINVLPIATNSSDTVYMPLLDVHETTGTDGTPGSEEATITYSADIPVRVRARQAGDILPYEADATVDNTGLTNNVIRADDTIFT